MPDDTPKSYAIDPAYIDAINFSLLATIDQLKQENERLRKALEFYAEPQRYIPNRPTSITQHECIQEQDRGAIASAAISPQRTP